MKVLILSVALLGVMRLSAQTDSSIHSSLPTYTSVHTLTRADIERLPASSFLELVQGAFPFVGSESPIEDEYSFVVNGFVLIHPNAINISQVESIRFFPVGTDLTRGSSTKKGTFVVTTRPRDTRASISTQTGFILPVKNLLSPSTVVASSSKGFYSIDEFNYSRKARRWFTSNSFSFLKEKFPAYNTFSSPQPANSEKSHSFSEKRRLRFSNFAGYDFSDRVKLEGGLFYTNMPLSSGGDLRRRYSDLNTDYTYDMNRKSKLLSGHAGLTALFSSRLSYQLSAELVQSKTNYETSFSSFFIDYPRPGTSSATYGKSTFSGHQTTFSIASNFLWKAVNTSSAALDLGLLVRDRFNNSRERNYSKQSQDGQPISFGESFVKRESQSFSVSPVAHLRFKNVLFAEVGFSYDDYTESLLGPNKDKKLLPNAGARLELASLLKSSLISSLEFSGNYNSYLRILYRGDWLETDGQPGSTSTAFLEGYEPVKNWLLGVAIGIHNNRFVLKTQYRSRDEKIAQNVQLPFNPVYYQLTSKGLCFELKASVIEKQKGDWKVYATVYQDKRTLHGNSVVPPPTPSGFSDAGKAPWRGGLRTTATFNHFFFQAAALVNLNEAAMDKNGNFQNDLDRYNCNFLLAGYQIPFKQKAIKSLELNIQSRALFHSQAYAISRYIGLGAQLNF